MRDRARQNRGLFRDLLGHEVPVAALVGLGGIYLDGLYGPVGETPLGIHDLDARPGDDRPVALFEIGDAVGQRRESYGIRAEIHLSLSVTHRERGTFPRGDDQVVFAVEEKREGEGALEPGDGLLGGIARSQALVDVELRE